MKLHQSAVDKILYLVANYSGHKDEQKLRKYIEEMDFTPYERKTSNQDVILVLTEEYIKALRGQ
jgi:hypothetical protein